MPCCHIIGSVFFKASEILSKTGCIASTSQSLSASSFLNLHNLRSGLPTETPAFHKQNCTCDLWPVTHLRRPQLHQHGLPLSLLIGAFLLEDLPVGVEPEARARVLGQARRLQQLPQSLLSALGRSLLLCSVNKSGNGVGCMGGEKRSEQPPSNRMLISVI